MLSGLVYRKRIGRSKLMSWPDYVRPIRFRDLNSTLSLSSPTTASMSSVDSAVLTQILTQLESLQLSQQVLQAKVGRLDCFNFRANSATIARFSDQPGIASYTAY